MTPTASFALALGLSLPRGATLAEVDAAAVLQHRTDRKYLVPHITPGTKGPYSYPSRHTARSAAAVTLLSAFAPHRTADYRWMQDEVVYSRVYMAGHVPSDILAGTLLGDLVGDYELAAKGN